MDKIRWVPEDYGVDRAVGVRSACCGAEVHSKTNDDDMGAYCAKCKGDILDPSVEPQFNPMDMDPDLSMTATNVISRCCDAPVRGSYGSEMYRCAECGLSPCETYEVAK